MKYRAFASTLRSLFAALFVFAAGVTTASACFGPQLMVGYDSRDGNAYTAAVLFDVYISEKTGIAVKLVALDANPSVLLAEEKLDVVMYPLALRAGLSAGKLTVDGVHTFRYRTKISEDLRFSTLQDAVGNLSSRLTAADFTALAAEIAQKGKIRRTVKEFLVRRNLW